MDISGWINKQTNEVMGKYINGLINHQNLTASDTI